MTKPKRYKRYSVEFKRGIPGTQYAIVLFFNRFRPGFQRAQRSTSKFPFVLSELRMAFQIGFMLFLPFLIIDIIVASILMSMGMFMLPPMMISMPFKIMLFVLVDGWYLLISSMLDSF